MNHKILHLGKRKRLKTSPLKQTEKAFLNFLLLLRTYLTTSRPTGCRSDQCSEPTGPDYREPPAPSTGYTELAVGTPLLHCHQGLLLQKVH